MTSEKRELVRCGLLQVAELSPVYAVTVQVFQMGLSMRGIAGIERDDVLSELTYLADKGLLESKSKMVSPENRAWRITAKGRDFLATGGQL